MSKNLHPKINPHNFYRRAVKEFLLDLAASTIDGPVLESNESITYDASVISRIHVSLNYMDKDYF